MDRIDMLLRPLGITPRLKGYNQACYALSLIVEDPARLTALTKGVFTPTAEYFGCDMKCIERNIRFAVEKAWATNPDHLKKLAGFPLEKKPAVSVFLEIIAANVLG